ncbi:serine hydrolase [Saccharibacillus sp. JS10]|uniref:serine hydrolase domain-containing protein n=1 Tax=Saccharibacillus sp. JS10 TaxID=2950552 RepID=UPI00210E63ED|nr:serine hydrolase [Saccharibacillus sp. JS10]MCQ4086741.1 beta-lactamase family protein [Saccharibacillus sp. JS10]
MAGTQLNRRRPEEAGVNPQGIIDFLSAVDREKFDLRSFMLLRRGEVLAEGWWAPHTSEDRHAMYSVSKSFTSTAVGIAIEEGLLNVEDKVVDLLPHLLPENPHPNLLQMTVHDLLVMGTGQKQDPLEKARSQKDADWAKAFLSAEVENVPGSVFSYSSGATYMASVILQTLTGQKVMDYLEPRLFAPLGIERKTWQESPQGYTAGGWGLKLCSEDLAKFGQLYLQKGNWNGQQLVPEKWVELASSKRIDNGDDPEGDWGQGYGYQFWMCRHDAYRADGAYGQFCLVLPNQEAVVVLTSAISRTKELLNEVWDHLLPAMQSAPLPLSETGEQATKMLTQLEYAPEPAGEVVTGEAWSGETYQLKGTLDDGDLDEGLVFKSISLTAHEDGSIKVDLSLAEPQNQSEPFPFSLISGAGVWHKNENVLSPTTPGFPSDVGPIYASNSRRADGSIHIAIRFAEDPISFNWHFAFEDDTLHFEDLANPELHQKATKLTGTLENSKA